VKLETLVIILALEVEALVGIGFFLMLEVTHR
jgi:hypothetical protein